MRFPDTLHAAATAENKQTDKEIIFFSTVYTTTTNTFERGF